METPRVVFDHVFKRFRRGERHDALRDLIPAVAARCLGRRRPDIADASDFWAVNDVSFEVRPGEALGIIGRNGAGKSTILKLLTRILKPTRGACSVRGRAAALIEVAAGFHGDLTGRENIYLQGAILGMRRAEIAARFDAIVDFAGIDQFVDTQVKRYSSGMNARLGFSIAAHLSPDVLLIDEVLSVGDIAFQEKCQARMKKFKSEGVSIVFVSHHLPAVAQLCDNVLLLEGGSTVRLGPPAGVISEYCGGGGGGSKDLGEVAISATIRTAASPAGDAMSVTPGERLHIDVAVDFRIATEHSIIGIVVWDPTREIYVYGANSDMVGMPPIAARAGERRRFEFTLDANLTRGLYSLEVNIIDQDRHRFLGIARPIRHFHVVESVTYDGVANLYLGAHERTDGREERLVEALTQA
jgi:lipopolysaccharide transport system ATP-binding protein